MIDIIELTVAMELEGFLVYLSYIFLKDHTLNVSLKCFELVVVITFIVRKNWDCIIKLIDVRIGSVIY